MWRGERLLAFQKKVWCGRSLPSALMAGPNASIEVIIKIIIQRNSSSFLLFSKAAGMRDRWREQFRNGTEFGVRVCRDGTECPVVI